ncbi:rhomboid family intramembrane serine protease [Mesorhizobium sp. BE184]|uniref:rhomboid family intramembrane serine protease n=1 Tax=Mesorhizobium sp. BE184 TaxID=2817714 RepID=UPI002854BBB6|nr:rhomboid family intramembrane serine protease [Mesorhizobium sp. BE184]MDR7031991.1 membrane associated rhomboid family serine protease [Mesorhizobium sp. BE184]
MSDTETPAENGPIEPEAEPRREPVFNLPRIVQAIIALCAGVHVLRTYVLTDEQDFELLVRAAFIPIRYSGRYDFEFYALSSPFTYTFLHGGFMHLAVNMVWLAAFGSPLANRIGALRFALFFAATGLAAAFFFWAIHPLTQAPLVGASGAISGMMGAAARFAFRIDRSSGKSAFGGPPLPFSAVFRSRGVLTFLAVWMVINLVTGLIGVVPGADDQIAWEAHIGGFLAGFLGLGFFDRMPPRQDGGYLS